MTDKKKIRKEVERIHNLLPVVDGDNISLNYADRICTTLKMYIDSLQEEPISNDLEEASRNYADNEEYGDDVYYAIKAAFKAGAQWGKEQTEKQIKTQSMALPHGCPKEESVSKDLEEAASQYPSIICQISPQWTSEVENVFIAGAQWQKEQMIKEAIETTVCSMVHQLIVTDYIIVNAEQFGLKKGDKVKLIIIKEG